MCKRRGAKKATREESKQQVDTTEDEKEGDQRNLVSEDPLDVCVRRGHCVVKKRHPMIRGWLFGGMEPPAINIREAKKSL